VLKIIIYILQSYILMVAAIIYLFANTFICATEGNT
jgi:hypothetical protein